MWLLTGAVAMSWTWLTPILLDMPPPRDLFEGSRIIPWWTLMVIPVLLALGGVLALAYERWLPRRRVQDPSSGSHDI